MQLRGVDLLFTVCDIFATNGYWLFCDLLGSSVVNSLLKGAFLLPNIENCLLHRQSQLAKNSQWATNQFVN